jgi:hypothetical protein
MLKRLYLLTGTAILGLYGWAGIAGWEIGTPARGVVPHDVRQSPGGYRSFHFWHTGYHGGK